MIAVGAAVAYQVLAVLVIVPALQRLTGRPIDLSQLSGLRGDLPALLLWLTVSWTLAAFLEEMVFRGYVVNRLNGLVGYRLAGTVIAVCASAGLFGVAHRYQGVTGVVENVLTGLLLATLYVLGRRNLWIPILTHGAIDTIGFLLIFWGLLR